MTIELAVASLVIALSVWFVIRNRQSGHWVIGWMGLHRPKSKDCRIKPSK